MTDEPLIAKKLAFIETCVFELRAIARVETIDEDIREERFIEHTLQLAIQATLDVASHIVSSEKLGEPATHKDLFTRLLKGRWLAAAQVDPLRDMAGFRNVLVYGYTEVDKEIVKDVVRHHLDDLLGFIATVRARLSVR